MKPAPTKTKPNATVTIDRVGADGDGVGRLPDGEPAYIPYTLPGEQVAATGLVRQGQGWAARAASVSHHSPERQTAPCPLFGRCGGCTLQHWKDAPYAAWKAGRVAAALSRAGFASSPVAPLARTPPAVRRRVDLALHRDGPAVRVGLHARRSADIVDLTTCLVLDPRLVDLARHLRLVLPYLAGLRRAGSAVANLVDTGIDLLLRTDAPLTAADRTLLASFAATAGVARVAWSLGTGPAETACQLRPATITLSGVSVVPPPGAFLQASQAGEAAILAAVTAGLPQRMRPRARIIELFAGCGTLTFALARHARVVAYEGDADAHAALRRAASGLPIEAVYRDLARQPLTAKEMAGAGAIVLDPPYAGAAPQMPGIAAAAIPCVLYVSCNPSALARDATTLFAAGYRVAAATSIDQFLWSGQTEAVVAFTHPA